MKTQWNYNKPIARLIRSPGRRPFNNKTRTCPPRPRERARVGSSCMEKRVGERVETGVGRTDAAVRSCRHRRPAARVRTCKRINFSRAFMLADWPNYYGALRSLHSMCVRLGRSRQRIKPRLHHALFDDHVAWCLTLAKRKKKSINEIIVRIRIHMCKAYIFLQEILSCVRWMKSLFTCLCFTTFYYDLNFVNHVYKAQSDSCMTEN